MATKRLLTVSGDDPKELRRLLCARLGADEAAVLGWINHGAVYIGAKRCRDPRARLVAGDRLTIYVAAAQADAAPDPIDQMGRPDLNPGPGPGNRPDPEKGPLQVPRIVDRDDDVLVLDKPAGLLTQPGPTGGPSLLSWLEQQGERPYLIHRLDREASGLLVLARRREACAPLQAALSEGSVERRYLAVVQGRPAPPGGIGRIELRITVQQRDKRLRAALPREAPGGKEATTLYRIVQELPDDRTLLSLELLTGRTHQIRVHLSAIGHPIVGDSFYGGAPHARLLLHAQTLRFPHPVTRSPKEYTLPPGADFTAVATGPP